jgi:hypothetical protein
MNSTYPTSRLWIIVGPVLAFAGFFVASIATQIVVRRYAAVTTGFIFGAVVGLAVGYFIASWRRRQ